MLDNFYNKYIELNLNDYFEIGFDFKINKVLFFAALGLIAACIITNYIEAGVSITIKRLLRTETHTESCAKTLAELGLKDSRGARLATAKRGGLAAKLIFTAGERQPTYEEYVEEQRELKRQKQERRRKRFQSIFRRKKDCCAQESADTVQCDACATDAQSVSQEGATAEKGCLEHKRYYIPEDMRELAQRYIEKRSPTLSKTVISCVLIAAFYVAIAYLMPTLIDVVRALTV